MMAGVGQLDLVRALLHQVLITNRGRREVVDPPLEDRVDGAEVHLVDDGRLQVVVDERRRPEGAVERQPDRLVGLRLEDQRQPGENTASSRLANLSTRAPTLNRNLSFRKISSWM